MTITSHRLFAAAAMLACASVHASGGGAWDAYVNRSIPDIALGRYQAGELGVVMGSYNRVYLYQAWRSVALGADGLKAAPNPAGGLLRAVGSRSGGWNNTGSGREVYDAWKQAVSAALKQPPIVEKKGSALAYGYLNCPAGSYTFATNTLNELARRSDATPARLAAWVATQQQVFKFCGDDPEAPRNRYSEDKPVLPMPVALPSTEALYWRQMQQYQLASAAFYDENYTLSGDLFAQIGATDKHPLRVWGEYLSLRSLARAATYIPGPNAMQARWNEEREMRIEGPVAAAARLARQQEKLATIQARIAHIVADPTLAQLHEASRAIGRAMQVRLTPSLRFAELSKLLDNPGGDPYLEDHLGDWLVLANDMLRQPYGEGADRRRELRKNAGFVDWIQTLQQCREYQAKTDCASEQQHALALWKLYRKDGNQPLARSWMLAAAMLSDRMPPELEQASLQVAVTAPEYLTLRHALVRHYRLSKQADKARAIADAVLAGPQLAAADSTSARNQFLQERFAVATSPDDAANYLMRRHAGNLDPDTGEAAASFVDRTDIAADGLRWLNSGLSTADLLALASNPKLGTELRTNLNVAAWMRLDLLAQDDAALAAAAQLEQLAPELAALAHQYRTQTSAAERHYGLLVNAMRYGLSPVFQSDAGKPALRSAGDTLADMWCKMPATPGAHYFEETQVESSLPMPELGDTATRNRELAGLGALKTATGYAGAAVLQRAKAMPGDPELPWLLYVTVQSTRGGCLDDDASALSKSAFALLHKRYGKTVWANKTPYHY